MWKKGRNITHYIQEQQRKAEETIKYDDDNNKE